MITEWCVRIAVWGLAAFWLWLVFTVVLRKLGVPFAVATAAALGWIGAGLSLAWLLPLVEEWMARWFHLPRGLLTMR